MVLLPVMREEEGISEKRRNNGDTMARGRGPVRKTGALEPRGWD